MTAGKLRRYGVLLLALVLCGGLPLGGCSREDGSAAAKSDELMLLMLSEARAWQRRADLHLADGDVAAAIASVQEVLSIAFPPGNIEAEEVRLDAHARLAKLLLSTGGEEAENKALAQVEAGRKLATRDSFFRSHLESVAADVYTARAKRLTDPAEQKAARHQAIKALERTIEIDKQLQRALLNHREPTR